METYSPDQYSAARLPGVRVSHCITSKLIKITLNNKGSALEHWCNITNLNIKSYPTKLLKELTNFIASEDSLFETDSDP